MAKNTNRDEFTPATKRTIERQARGHCSNPMCRRLTSAGTSDDSGEIKIGEAAHICAAAPGGPRYDGKMTHEERRSSENGIWLCDVHARAVDSKDSKFTVGELREWKRQTKEDSWRSVMHNLPYAPGMQAPTPDELRNRLRAATAADLAVFRRTAKWPRTTVPLTLKVDYMDEPLSTRALANAVTSLDDLILVAAPGMGKTTTVFQVAEGILEIGNGTALVVPLGDWATENDRLLASILKRPAFSGLSEADFRAAASKPGVVLLLDGWNELDADARERARVQIMRLQAELPELSLVISTRKQSRDIPFAGTRVDLLPLSDKQQLDIARTMRGDTGEKLVDQASRTAGIRDLIAIPLYLNVLLSLPEGAPFPTSKEEVLRQFVAAQEQEARRSEALSAATDGLQQNYLEELAVFATKTANTAITDSNARRSVTDTARLLMADGQVTIITAQPDALLCTLVSNHMLMRSGDTPGYSFQHQQFQEWYASHHVERLMLQAVSDKAACDKLKANILNERPWEEAILFAVERAARGDTAQKATCGAAILAAFEIDPILAGEMIFRATDEVWAAIDTKIYGLVEKWHAPGKVDRAVRFMITSGRWEFGDLLWPLLTHQNDQVHLAALRAARRFRPSVLGSDAPKRIAALPLGIRKNVLHEIASESDMDGLDLATAIAKADGDPDVKATVVDALSFRRADRHVADLLSGAGDVTYDIVAKKGHIDDITVEAVQQGLEAARGRHKAAGVSHHERLQALLYGRCGENRNAEVTDIVAEMKIDQKHNGDLPLLYEARKHYPQALAEGLLRRVRENRPLFYGADDILAAAGFALDDDALLNIVLEESNSLDNRAHAAASVLGPQAVGKLIEAYLAESKLLRDAGGAYNQAATDRYLALGARIPDTPGTSLLAAVQARAAAAGQEEIAELAGLFSLKMDRDQDCARLFNEEGLAAIGVLARDWGNRMLTSGTAKRGQTASIAALISQAPSATLLPLLKRLLDDNLRRYNAFREEAHANGWRHGEAVNEARAPYTLEYLCAFSAIQAPETTTLMAGYLDNEHFGELAATVLAVQWSEVNDPKDNRGFRCGGDFTRVDFRHVYANQAARAADPSKSSSEAELIFDVIDSLLVGGATEEQKKLAVALGIVGTRLPHGQRDATIQKLVALAPRQARANLLFSLVLSGEDINIKLVADGIAETFEAAKKETWILTGSRPYQLREWLCLLPFTTPVSEVPAVVRAMPDSHRNPRLFEEMIDRLGYSPSDDAETVLFKLAEEYPRFYFHNEWCLSVLRLRTVSSARRLVDLAASGTWSNKAWHWYWQRELGSLISEFPELRAHIQELFNDGSMSESLALLAHAVAEDPGTDGLLMLVDSEIKTGRSFLTWRSIQSAVTERVPCDSWKDAYNIVPVPAVELRQKLLAMTTSGGTNDPAARCLNSIDKLRDDYGALETELRHPDLASGRQWPMMTPDPDEE